jgi:acyl-CoA thioesterase 8
VKAVQTGNVIFTMTCSFQKPEPWQPSHQWPIPNVPPPDQCLLEEEWLLQLTESESNKVHPKLKEFFQILAAVSNETAGYWLEW